MPIIDTVQTYLATTPPEELGAHFLLVVAPFVIGAVLIWGFLQVWVDRKQGQYWAALKWDLVAVSVPADSIQTPKGMENFFNNLAGSKSSITMREQWILGKFQAYFGFEIVSDGGHVTFYMRMVNKYRDLVEASLYAQYPEAQITEVEDYVDVLPNDYPNDEFNLFGSELSMSKDSMFPLKTYETFEHQGEKDLRFKDPLLPMLEMLGKMRPGEYYWIQILIMSPDSQDWRKAGGKYIKKMYGMEEKKKKGWLDENIGWLPRGVMEQLTGFASGEEGNVKADDFRMFKITPDERDMLDAVAKKSSQIGWYTKIRVVYGAKHEVFRKGTIASMTKGIFNQFDAGWNKLSLTSSSTPKDDYPWQEWVMPKKQRLLIKKYKNRSFGAGANPFILTSEELATIFHFPSADARTPVLTSLGARRAEAPQELLYAGEDDEVLPNFAPSGTGVPPTPSHPAPAVPIEEGAFSSPVQMVVPVPVSPTHTSQYVPASAEVESPEAGNETADVTIPRRPDDQPHFAPSMPAPLPPGLDLSDEPIDAPDAPRNLPT